MGVDDIAGAADKTRRQEKARHDAKIRRIKSGKIQTHRTKKIGEFSKTNNISYEAQKNSMKLDEFFEVKKKDDDE